MNVEISVLILFPFLADIHNKHNLLNSLEFSFLRSHGCVSAIQEFLKILLNPKVHYDVNKDRPMAPILSQLNPIRITPSYFCNINFNIILAHTSRSSYWSRSIWLSHQKTICIPLLPQACFVHACVFFCTLTIPVE